MALSLATGAAEPRLLDLVDAACLACDAIDRAALAAVRARVAPTGRIDAALLEREQHAAHGLAWLRVHTEALRQMRRWASRLDEAGTFRERERLILGWAFAEYLARIEGGIAMSQGEVVRLADLGIPDTAIRLFRDTPAVRQLRSEGATPAMRARLAELIQDGEFGDPGWADPTLADLLEPVTRFVADKVTPFAHGWHARDELIPMSVIDQLAELGLFGLTIPEAHGGLGLGKTAMCVVTEALSRGYIGVGSLGTRTEIAAELIRLGGTPAQQERWLPSLADGSTLPTAVFTEPDIGSDLASLTTRAVLEDGVWRVTGAKNWITHAARADLMTILCRTDPSEKGHKGLSILLAPKPRGTDAEPFPIDGLKGSEIPVLGYRGMKEYALAFDGFAVPADGLLGGVHGQGFRQLMETFESARIQTAARAVGVAVNALDLGLAYARDRKQFGKAIHAFPRVHQKLGWAVVEIMIARQLTLFAAEEKDAGRRCDLEAGLAKLLAAQVAWSVSDNSLQIHGGNGYAMEYQIARVLCDSRILNVFEGAAEIQAQVIARRLMAAE